MPKSVYKQLTTSESEFLLAVKEEIGLKTGCLPFAQKVIEAFKTLPSNKMSEQESRKAANVFLSGMQTLIQGGIIAEDYDKLDFVKRGKTIVPSARVEAFYRAAARKGYRISDTIIPVPADDMNTTYFEEQFHNGDIVYILKDLRKTSDRAITAQRIKENYFSKYLIRLDVHDVQKGTRLAMIASEIYQEDLMQIINSSEQGFYKAQWQKYRDDAGYEKNRRVITTQELKETFWVKWTGEMLAKTLIRRALKRVKEVLPELKQTIYAFEQDEETPQEVLIQAPVEIPVEVIENNVDLKALTDEQKQYCREMFDVFKANPKLAKDTLNMIKDDLDNGVSKQEVINHHYPEIMAFLGFANLVPQIKELFRGYIDE